MLFSRKKLLTLIITLPAIVSVAGCSQSSGTSEVAESSSEDAVIYTAENPLIRTLSTSEIDTIAPIDVVAPFTIYNEDGTVAEITKNYEGKTSTKGGLASTYENMYEALRLAGANASTKETLQVQDANHVQIWIKDKLAQCYVFDGPDYIGTCGQKTAKNYCLAHPNAYAVNGFADDYYYLGRYDMVEGQTVTENVLETPAGAYNYMFSNGGRGGTDYGYRYCTADVRLSEATYRPADNDEQWNAYIFINLQENILSDLGLIGVCDGSKVTWSLVRNCMSKAAHGSDTFHTYPDQVVTTSTVYDAETKTYSGFDDLHFEAFTLDNGWILNITNLRTSVTYTLEDRHYDENGEPLVENDAPVHGRALIAASYCPVVGNVWNWNCGAFLKNVIWENINLRKAIVDGEGVVDNDIEHYRAEGMVDVPFWPGESCYRDGYSQGGYCASHEFGTRTNNGTYASGAEYKTGDKYLIYSVEYKR